MNLQHVIMRIKDKTLSLEVIRAKQETLESSDEFSQKSK